ncbi:MAG TPA: hypothetical protein VH044_09830, partial [Polyangiaceae bacterium]|nr:hypothetical protein [Polyangiaceae bacterium]
MALIGAVVAVADARPCHATGAETEAHLALSSDGHIGAWLVAGPFDHPRAPDEDGVAPRLGDATATTANAPRWRLASTSDGAVDIGGAIESRWYVGAFAAGVLHVEHAGRYYLLLGVGDAVTATVDGKRVLARQEPRPEQDEDDLLALDLAAGDHPIVLALHRYGLARSLRARLL